MRELPPCPKLEDPQQHPLYDDILMASESRYDKVGNQWRGKPYWMQWISSPSAIPITHVSDFGEMTFDDTVPFADQMQHDANDMELGTMLILKTDDHQDIIECSECRSSYTCSQDMELMEIDPMGGADAKWEVA